MLSNIRRVDQILKLKEAKLKLSQNLRVYFIF